jgi:hypothetical protein
VSQSTTSATVGRAIRGRRVAHTNGRQGAPDTGQCPVRQPTPRCNGRLRQFWKEICTGHATGTVRWCIGLSPVHHPTEGNFGLPCWPPTAPSCLGAIKKTLGAWRKYPSISLSNSKSPHSVSTHSIDRVSDLSSVLAVNSLCFI